eukprot:m.57659 g.57659  ORF g.57659 m.57659 type:complete len:147 (+) comp49062_c1_seq2:320-760(+)
MSEFPGPLASSSSVFASDFECLDHHLGLLRLLFSACHFLRSRHCTESVTITDEGSERKRAVFLFRWLGLKTTTSDIGHIANQFNLKPAYDVLMDLDDSRFEWKFEGLTCLFQNLHALPPRKPDQAVPNRLKHQWRNPCISHIAALR